MSTKTLAFIPRTMLALLLSCSAAAVATAQVRSMRPDTAMKHPAGMAHTAGMAAMMSSPHHALSMGYRENLMTFARALNADVTRSHRVAIDLARPATSEMRRAFDQMKAEHETHMSSMGTQMTMPMPTDTAMGGMMRDMQTHMTAISTHLAALEGEVAKDAPDAAMVLDHTAQILKQSDGMMPMRGAKVGMGPRPYKR